MPIDSLSCRRRFPEPLRAAADAAIGNTRAARDPSDRHSWTALPQGRAAPRQRSGRGGLNLPLYSRNDRITAGFTAISPELGLTASEDIPLFPPDELLLAALVGPARLSPIGRSSMVVCGHDAARTLRSSDTPDSGLLDQDFKEQDIGIVGLGNLDTCHSVCSRREQDAKAVKIQNTILR